MSALAVVAIVAAMVTVALVPSHRDNTGNTSAPAATLVPAAGSPTSSAARTIAEPTPTPGTPRCGGVTTQPGAATPAGWQQVIGPFVLYDVPATWTVSPCSFSLWNKPDQKEVTFGDASIEAIQGCGGAPDSPLPVGGTYFTRDTDGRSLQEIAADAVGSFGADISQSPTAPHDAGLAGFTAVRADDTIRDSPPAAGCPDRVILKSVIVYRWPDVTGAIVLHLRVKGNFPGGPSAAEAQRTLDDIIGSLRPAAPA